jgi:hypothetical protein
MLENVTPIESLAPASTVFFQFVITDHLPVHKERIAIFMRSYVEFYKHLLTVEIVS